MWVDTRTPAEWDAMNKWSAWMAKRVIVPVVRHKPVETKPTPDLAQSIAAHMKRGRKRRAAA